MIRGLSKSRPSRPHAGKMPALPRQHPCNNKTAKGCSCDLRSPCGQPSRGGALVLRYNSRMALFYLVRHGETAWNAELKLCGRTDVELNDAGRRQAERLGERLRRLPSSTIYTSPLKRTVETAEIIRDVASLPRHEASGVKPPLHVDDRIVELNYGEWEGKKFDEVKTLYSDLYRRWDADPATEAPPGGETGFAGVARIAACLDDMKKRHTGKNDKVIVVTHKTVCRLAICHALGLAASEYRRRLSMSNTAVNIIAPEPDGWRVVVVNDTSHLDGTECESATSNGTF